MTRIPLFNRRGSQVFTVEHVDPLAEAAAPLTYYVSTGSFPDGSTGEVFINPKGKAGKGSMLEAIARDAAILMSLAIQYGCKPETMRRAITRDEKERPMTFVGAVLDALEEKKHG